MPFSLEVLARRTVTIALLAAAGCYVEDAREARRHRYYEERQREAEVAVTPGDAVVAPVPVNRVRLAEEPRYVQAYNGIHRPRLILFVNRHVTDQLMPVNPNATVRPGPAPYDDRATAYLRPGEFDPAQARAIDYPLIERVLTDDLSGGGRVQLVPPQVVRVRLGDGELRDLEAGRPRMLGELAVQQNGDVLVQVTVHPIRQAYDGLSVRLVAEALNTHGGQAIGFASVDVPPPANRGDLGRYVRFVSRKLMGDMSASWEAMALPGAVTVSPPAPPETVQPAVPAPVAPTLPTTTPPASSSPPTAVAPIPAPVVPGGAATPSPTTQPLDLPPPP